MAKNLLRLIVDIPLSFFLSFFFLLSINWQSRLRSGSPPHFSREWQRTRYFREALWEVELATVRTDRPIKRWERNGVFFYFIKGLLWQSSTTRNLKHRWEWFATPILRQKAYLTTRKFRHTSTIYAKQKSLKKWARLYEWVAEGSDLVLVRLDYTNNTWTDAREFSITMFWTSRVLAADFCFHAEFPF